MSEEDTERRLVEIEHKIDELDAKIDRIDVDLAKYRGMVGGILLVVTAVVAFFKLAWDGIKEHVTFQ